MLTVTEPRGASGTSTSSGQPSPGVTRHNSDRGPAIVSPGPQSTHVPQPSRSPANNYSWKMQQVVARNFIGIHTHTFYILTHTNLINP